MSKLPNWMQGILFFCALTGLAFWWIQIEEFLNWYLWGSR